jgi:hypothetical protein
MVKTRPQKLIRVDEEFTAQVRKPFKISGAGEGNRTLVSAFPYDSGGRAQTQKSLITGITSRIP